MERPTLDQLNKHRLEKKHKRENPLRDVILGGQDGLVNALGIILGFSAVSSDIHILIATVFAATAAESLSMGAVAYTSMVSQKEHYEGERRKESREIETSPKFEKEEIRQIYEAKGFKGKVLEEIVQTITSDKKLWLDTMMSDELNLSPVNMRAVVKSSIIVTVTTTIGHLLPLIPFFFVTQRDGIIFAIAISIVALFATGVYQAVTLVGSWWKSGLRMVLIGMGAALIGYLIASIFHTSS